MHDRGFHGSGRYDMLRGLLQRGCKSQNLVGAFAGHYQGCAAVREDPATKGDGGGDHRRAGEGDC
jgi:hypothetical protein